MQLQPPFKPAATALVSLHAPGCCEPAQGAAGRARLADLDPHLHCSLIGTCLGTHELRKLMGRFIEVQGASDLEVHHEAVRLAAQGGPVAKALHKALEQRHEAAVRRFAAAHDDAALARLWREALRSGEVPGAYWALLTHRAVDDGLRQQAFGDVHMLSHLVGASNRADIRRLQTLEQDNAELHERLQNQQQRLQAALAERERLAAQLAQQQEALLAAQSVALRPPPPAADDRAAERITLHTARREQAERAAAAALLDAQRLRDELVHRARQTATLARELGAAETQLRALVGDGSPDELLARALQGRRVLYVGGRPSSAAAIRALVQHHGGELQRHDGGLEDRKGLLAAAVAWAGIVLFPVDCIDHDSAGQLKRLCQRSGKAFLPLRSASVASFVAALSGVADESDDEPALPGCPRHA